MEGIEILNFRDFLPLIGVVVGGGLAILGGFFSTLWLEWSRERKQRRALALAFQGEVGAILDIIEKRGYIDSLRNTIARMRNTGETQVFYFRARRTYFNVYEANVGKIGILRPPLSELVARFYTQANSVLEDMERFEGQASKNVDMKTAVLAYEELLTIFEDMVMVGTNVVEEVSRHYS